MNDPTRNVNYEDGSKCDNPDDSQTSVDWKGPAYYRFQSGAGTKMPTKPVAQNHCNTDRGGWINDINGQIPNLKVGEELTVRACFHTDDPNCDEKHITVTRCPGRFYVYYLVTTPRCNYRYCGTFQYTNCYIYHFNFDFFKVVDLFFLNFNKVLNFISCIIITFKETNKVRYCLLINIKI